MTEAERFEITHEIYGSAGGWTYVDSPSYGEAILTRFAALKEFDSIPKHAHIGTDGFITFRGKTIGQIK